MAEFTFRQLQKCAEREIALRNNVFRKRGLTPEREEEVAKMVAIATHFKDLADADELAGRNPDAQMFITMRSGKSVYVPMFHRQPPDSVD
jgi:hypothetical protein